jgi:hypothetical protein
MERRTLLGVIGGSLLAAPLVAEAQPAEKVYRLGSVAAEMSTIPPGQGPFHDRMRELGWVYGQNYVVSAAPTVISSNAFPTWPPS